MSHAIHRVRNSNFNDARGGNSKFTLIMHIPYIPGINSMHTYICIWHAHNLYIRIYVRTLWYVNVHTYICTKCAYCVCICIRYVHKGTAMKRNNRKVWVWAKKFTSCSYLVVNILDWSPIVIKRSLPYREMSEGKGFLEKSLGKLLGFEDGALDVLDHLLTIESKDVSWDTRSSVWKWRSHYLNKIHVNVTCWPVDL